MWAGTCRKDNAPPGNPLCKICSIEPEDARHFLVTCPCLSALRRELLSKAPVAVSSAIPDVTADPSGFFDIVLGIEWIDDPAIQICIHSFIAELRSLRNSLYSAAPSLY